ncbi:DUF4241 domain-containing protein [Paenibacillus sp. H1-7]|uniref:DUF4241 domain-containing protein n=1 Tax=Paenibacillus sp. H1-7 TaxID=2282849 RepID=UPI001EF7E467|nr:DUF4241 domain-containing protein [Paenibacillus sp. H1-7]ULL15652.1 DUF4241 domain-containing protein [Paenibacillus sp. H1-7]
MIRLGSFEVGSGSLIVSDPCYDHNVTAMIRGVIDQVLNGTWIGYVEKQDVRDWGEACSRLVACHASLDERKDDLHWMKCSFIVGVDSGQAGIFDIAKYRIPDVEGQDQAASEDSEWYQTCCDITESAVEAGVMDGGVVSRTGMGDGAYGAYLAVNESNQAIGVKIIFIRGSEV